LFKQQKKLTLFLLGGFSLLAGLILILTATVGKNDLWAAEIPNQSSYTIANVTINDPRHSMHTPPPATVAYGGSFSFRLNWNTTTDYSIASITTLLAGACELYSISSPSVNGTTLREYSFRNVTGNITHIIVGDYTIALPPQSGMGWTLVQ